MGGMTTQGTPSARQQYAAIRARRLSERQSGLGRTSPPAGTRMSDLLRVQAPEGHRVYSVDAMGTAQEMAAAHRPHQTWPDDEMDSLADRSRHRMMLGLEREIQEVEPGSEAERELHEFMRRLAINLEDPHSPAATLLRYWTNPRAPVSSEDHRRLVQAHRWLHPQNRTESVGGSCPSTPPGAGLEDEWIPVALHRGSGSSFSSLLTTEPTAAAFMAEVISLLRTAPRSSTGSLIMSNGDGAYGFLPADELPPSTGLPVILESSAPVTSTSDITAQLLDMLLRTDPHSNSSPWEWSPQPGRSPAPPPTAEGDPNDEPPRE